MPRAPLPPDEQERLRDLQAYEVLDTAPEASLDDLVSLAAAITGTPISVVSLIDADRQWFKAKLGVEFTETCRDASFCAHAILDRDVLVVPDTAFDRRFAENPLVLGEPHIRFYAGVPLVTPRGHVVGALCVADVTPRHPTAAQVQALRVLGRQVINQLELRRTVRLLGESERLARSRADAHALLAAVVASSDDAIVSYALDGTFTSWNAGAERMFGYAAAEIVGQSARIICPPDRLHEEGANWRRLAAGERIEHFETVRLAKGGRPVDVSATISPVRDAAGHMVGVSKVVRDVTAQKRADLELARMADQRRMAMDAADLGWWHRDGATGTVHMDGRCKAILGFAAEGAHGEVLAIVHPDDQARVDAAVLASTRPTDPQPYKVEYRAVHPGGAVRWVRSVGRAYFAGEEPGRRMTDFFGTIMDFTAEREAQDHLRHASTHDALTGLPNRVLFAERVDRCITLSKRPRYTFGVLFLDLDRFKLINDSIGHAAGDKVLTTIAARIAAALRPADLVAVPIGSPADDGPADGHTVARMGGDEFTVLLENLRAPTDAARVAERIRSVVCKPIAYEGHELTVSASIGIVTCGGDGGRRPATYATAKDLLRDADAAMYKAKAAGKDRYAVFDPTMHVEVVARMTLEADLRRAVDRRELELHYQPIVAIAGDEPRGRTVGFEALIRWRRNGTLVSPADFIPVAEDTGIIVPIGTWVLREACGQLARWRTSGGAMADLYVTVNVSRRQLADPAFAETVRLALLDAGLPASAVGLEITEGAVMQDAAAAERTLAEVRSVTGVRFLMDDFGTGYSSLACLQRFPIQVLKIDRAFVQAATAGQREAAVVEIVIMLAQRLGLSVVAEGVESAEQAALLAAAGCDLAQGYLFSRPLTPAAAARFVLEAAAVRLTA